MYFPINAMVWNSYLCILQIEISCHSCIIMHYFMRIILNSLFIIGVVCLAIPNVYAQNGQGGQIVAPWMETTGEIRNYGNFRSLQIDPTRDSFPPQDVYARRDEQQTIGGDAQFYVLQSAQAMQNTTKNEVSEREEQLPSAIEQSYASRITKPLTQFGYDMFGTIETDHGKNSFPETTPAFGAMQDNFMLRQGDELEVIFTGQRSERDTYTINSNGLLIIPDIPPISAAGRSLGQVSDSLRVYARNMPNTDVFVSLSSVRQINALVIGHVKQPGRKSLTVFHTVLDAIMAAGGIDKTGSLRQVKLVRDGRSMYIDLYALLMHGQNNIDITLYDGDRIIVPPIGPTVAVSGEVKRPGIYEILPRQGQMKYELFHGGELLSLNEMLDFSGGVLMPGQNRMLKLGFDVDGHEQVETIDDPIAPIFGDGSILAVTNGEAKRQGSVELLGHTRRPGMYALSDYQNLSNLLNTDAVLGADIYPLIGVIARIDDEYFTRRFMAFPLQAVLKGEYDLPLKDGDGIYLLSNAQIRHLSSFSPDELDANYRSVGSLEDDVQGDMPIINDPLLVSFLKERSAFIRGAVREPGAYPVTDGVNLPALIASAGGLTVEANKDNIEVTSSSLNEKDRDLKSRKNVSLEGEEAHSITIGAGDSVRVNRRFDKVADQSVLLMGEVVNPGYYDLMPGDHLSSLIDRAGGLTPEAYAYGTIFSRKAERMAEENRYKSQSRAIKQAVANAIQGDEKDVNAGKIAEARALAQELDTARGIGRITVEADPSVLSAQPELDILLQAGDRIFIPKRDLTVRVYGEILSPASLQFREGKAPLDYIHEAGGFTFHADKDRSFVVYPDGSAQPLQVSVWNYNPVFIPPGSTIIVPRDPEPFDFIQSAKDVSQILSNLAVTAIFIDDVISDN